MQFTITGIGDAGCAALSPIQLAGLYGVHPRAVNTHSYLDGTVLIGESILGGIGAGGKPGRGRDAAEVSKD
ncbi:MAG: cell division protein FtsZ, partial [Anaerolineae bacterium]|nr:cell division protein FtsZ [Anaerolineae bacterium]